MSIDQWDRGHCVVTCNGCGFELPESFSYAVDAENMARRAGWEVHEPTYDPPVHLARQFKHTPFYEIDWDTQEVVITDKPEYHRLLKQWGAYCSRKDCDDKTFDELVGLVEEYLDELCDDAVWRGDCWCHTCKGEE